MQELEFWKSAIMDRVNLLDDLTRLLREARIPYCVIGGAAVNAYAPPLISLDLDLAVAGERLGAVEALLRERFEVEAFPHSLNVSAEGSGLRVQIQTDPRYFGFAARAVERDVLGLRLPVACIEDVMRGKVWAASDPAPSPGKRRKDLLDIERLLEAHPELRPLVPDAILAKIESA
jgi:hypothetical protein